MLNNAKIRNPFPMIGNVFKYEFKSGTKTLGPIFGIMILLGILMRIFLSDSFENLTSDTVKVTLGMLLFITCFAAFIITMVLIEKRFKKGMLEDEAYLNLSLPVTMTEHIVGRLLTFSVWFLMYTVASFITAIILVSGEVFKEFSFNEISEFFQSFYEEFGVKFGVFMTTGVVYGLSVMLLFIMFIMIVNTIAHLVKKNRMVCEIVTSVVIIVVFINIIKLILGPDFFASGAEAVRLFYRGIWKLTVTNFIFVVINVIATQGILKVRLNLE